MKIEWKALILMAAVVAVGCGPTGVAGENKAETLTEKTFDASIAKGVVLVDFWATWCPPCRRQGPIVDAVAKKMAGKATVAKLDVDTAKDVSKRFNVSSIPTLIIFKDGKPVKTFVGLTSEQKLLEALNKQLK